MLKTKQMLTYNNIFIKIRKKFRNAIDKTENIVYNENAIGYAFVCVWRSNMKYEIPTCEIVKLNSVDIITSSKNTYDKDSRPVRLPSY